MKLWTKILTVILVTGAYLFLTFSSPTKMGFIPGGAFLCILILICTFVILGRIKALESKIEALAGERNKPETGETESEGNR